MQSVNEVLVRVCTRITNNKCISSAFVSDIVSMYALQNGYT